MLCTNDVNWLLKITGGFSEYATLEKLNKIVTSIFQCLPVIQLLSYVENKFKVTTLSIDISYNWVSWYTK